LREGNKGEGKGRTAQSRAVLGTLVACHNDTPQNCGVSVRHATNNFSEVLEFNTPLISEVSKNNLL